MHDQGSDALARMAGHIHRAAVEGYAGGGRVAEYERHWRIAGHRKVRTTTRHARVQARTARIAHFDPTILGECNAKLIRTGSCSSGSRRARCRNGRRKGGACNSIGCNSGACNSSDRCRDTALGLWGGNRRRCPVGINRGREGR